MPARLKFFERRMNACNPYREFWEFLEWLARRRQYPEPMHVWRGVTTPPLTKAPFMKPKPMKFPGAGSKDFNGFPAADERKETVNIYRRK
jgi:hypothetical protein